MKKNIVILLILFTTVAFAKDIHVKYRDKPVDVGNGHFEKLNLKYSSFVKKMYYDKQNNYLVVRLKNTFYHYCGIPDGVVKNWIGSSSLGRYYNYHVKGNFDCRINYVPDYGVSDENK